MWAGKKGKKKEKERFEGWVERASKFICTAVKLFYASQQYHCNLVKCMQVLVKAEKGNTWVCAD